MSRPLVNHKLHIILSVLTGTLWLFVYLPIIWLSRKPSYVNYVLKKRAQKIEKSELKTQVRKEKVNQQQKYASTQLGYKPSKSKWATAWTLECGHLIRAMDWTSGKEGKMVLCSVCNSQRRVVSSNPWNY